MVRAKQRTRLPVVLAPGEVKAVLRQMEGTPRLIAALLYGTGMRLGEALALRVKDLDFRRREIRVCSPKGVRDRLTVFPDSLAPDLRMHVDEVKRQFRSDLAAGDGWVELPKAHDRKSPNAPREWQWQWQWVFPASRHYEDGKTGQRRRHHLHEMVLQRAFRDAVRTSEIPKRATCHTLSTLLPHTYSRAGTTSGQSRSCWATRTCARR